MTERLFSMLQGSQKKILKTITGRVWTARIVAPRKNCIEMWPQSHRTNTQQTAGKALPTELGGFRIQIATYKLTKFKSQIAHGWPKQTCSTQAQPPLRWQWCKNENEGR